MFLDACLVFELRSVHKIFLDSVIVWNTKLQFLYDADNKELSVVKFYNAKPRCNKNGNRKPK